MRLEVDHCQARARDAEVARLATSGLDGRPHLVPVTFAFVGEQVVSAVDQKPKSTTSLRRLRNIGENPRVCLLWDRYDDDWTQLWWVRGDGRARVCAPGSQPWAEAVEALRARYRQYLRDPPRGPAIVVDVESWSGWSHGPHRN
jgi:PPOX class probable F420-dependent enzyme